MGEDYKPEFSIVTVKPISKHHSVDATFIQLQINEQKIRGDGRLSTNIGIGIVSCQRVKSRSPVQIFS